MVLMSMRIGCSVSLWRKTSTGRIPTASGLALPNFSLARSGSVYELTETVIPSCLSAGSEAEGSFAAGFLGELDCAEAAAHTSNALTRREKIRVEVRIMTCLSDAGEPPQVVRG